MTDLRTAAQQALEALEGKRYTACGWRADCDKAITALRAALANPQEPGQEPVAKVELMTTGGNAGLATRIVEIDDHLRERLRPGQLLYTAPPQRPAEPVQESQGCDHCEHPLYAGTRETLRLVDELALCAELKREYQEQFAQAAVQRDALLEALRELLADAEFLGWDTAKARAAIKQAEENT